MRFIKVESARNTVLVFCCRCECKLYVESNGREQPYPVWADLDGEAFKAYYCTECKQQEEANQ